MSSAEWNKHTAASAPREGRSVVIDAGAGCRIQGSALPSDPDAAARVLWRLARPENDRVPRAVCEALGLPGSPEPDVGVVAARLGISQNLRVLRAGCALTPPFGEVR